MLQVPARYVIRGPLGEGGMGKVYLAFDREREAEVAFKLHAPPAGGDEVESRYLFKQEFWAMASLRHPNLVAAYDYGELEDGTPYFTMAVVPGVDLAGAEMPQAEGAVRGWLPGIAGALGYLHRAGYVHGDLKPENVRILPDGTGLLMDLGLLTRRGNVGGPIRGSLPYMAPEAIRQGAVDPRADLYGLGAVLYHALAGRPPFMTQEPMALLRAHLSQAPEALALLRPEISRRMAEAVMTLLAKEPAARYNGVGEMLQALELATEEGAAGLLSSPLVGRREVQQQLSAPEPGTIWLTGAAGAGKTRLLAEARAEAQLAGRTVFAAAGQGTEAPPYQVLLPWLRALIAAPGEERNQAAPVLARLLPELGVEPLPTLEGPKERLRLHATVAGLAIARAPEALWLVDAADQLDAASQELVAYMRRQGEADPAIAWRWVLAAEPESGGAAAPENAEILPLPPLNEPDVLDVARALLGQEELPAPVVERLAPLTGGLPGAIEALLGHWLEAGMLVRSGGRWQPRAGAAFDLPSTWNAPLEAALAAASPETRAVARAAAILGKDGDMAALAAIAPVAEAAFFEAFAALEAAGMVERQDSRFRFTRPAQVQALQSAGAPEERQALHDRAARWLEARLGSDPQVPTLPLGEVLALARHRLEGTEPERAMPWVLVGADRAIALFAIDTAEPHLRRALAVLALTPEDRVALQMRLGFALRYQGQLEEALALYEAEIVPALRGMQAGTLAQELVTLGLLLQMRGRKEEARPVLEEAIGLAGERQDVMAEIRGRIFAGRFALFAGETAKAIDHLATAVRLARAAGATALLSRALSLYGYLLAAEEPARRAEGQALLEEAVTLSHQLGDLLEAQEARNNQGNVYMSAGMIREAHRAYEACLALCERIGTPNELTFAHLNLGLADLELGDYGAAAANARQAVEMSRAQGRKFPESLAQAIEGLASIRMGDTGSGLERLEAGLALTQEIGSKYMELHVSVVQAEAWLHVGQAAGAAEAIARSERLAEETHNAEHRLKLMRLAAVVALLRGEPDAEAALEAALAAAREAGSLVAEAHALAWQGRVRLTQGDDHGAVTMLEEAARLADAEGLLGLAGEIAALRAQAATQSEDTLAAADFWADALARAEETADAFLLVQAARGVADVDRARRDLAHVASERLSRILGPLSASEREAFFTVPMRERRLSQPASMEGATSAERVRLFTDLLAEIAAETDLDGVLAHALPALLALTGLERGFLLLYQGFEVTRQVFHGMSEAEADEFSTSLANRVLWSGRPLFLEDAQADADLGGQQSIQALNLHTVLGLPLLDGDEVVGVMLADARRVIEGFSEVDMDLAIGLARQVGTAVAGARRLAEARASFDEYRLLHELALQSAGAETLEAFMSPLAARALALTGAERALLLAGEALNCRVAFGPDGKPLTSEPGEISTSISRWVLAHGEPLHLEDAQSEEAFQTQRSVLALGLRTVVAVPVRRGEEVAGVLYLDARRLLEPDGRAVRVLSGIADLIGAFWARRGL